LSDINKTPNIDHLKLILSEAGNYKVEKLKKIIEEKIKREQSSKKTEVYKVSSEQIETEDDLKSYIERLHKSLLKKLRENKIIIIE